MNATRRLLAISAVLLLSVLTACTNNGPDTPTPGPTQPAAPTANINQQPRGAVADGGELRLPVAHFGTQFNPLHADGAWPRTQSIMGAMLPKLFHRDGSGNPVPNPDYLSAVDATGENPQVVTYTLNPDATWGSGRNLQAEDFIANWKACNGQNVSFNCAETERLAEVASVQKGNSPQQVVVTYRGSYAEWPATFEYLLPKEGVSDPKTFNEGWKDPSKIADWLAGPFTLSDFDRDAGVLTTVPDENWWADPPKLSRLTFIDVPKKNQLQAFQEHKIDVADRLGGEQGEAEAAKINGVEVRTAEQGDNRQAVAVRRNLANYGAFGASSVSWPDVGFLAPAD